VALRSKDHAFIKANSASLSSANSDRAAVNGDVHGNPPWKVTWATNKNQIKPFGDHPAPHKEKKMAKGK
jgi:hypothetical protein